MDLTPDVLAGIEFRRKGRGYAAEDVDAFRQAVETWAGEMQARLREATSKLDEAETRARDAEERARTSAEGDETIQRTLLLAQRTADSAVAEAEETAARKVAEAEAESDRLRTEAEAESDRLLTEARNHREQAIAGAEAEVREAIDLKRAELLDELATLERARDTLAGDVATLEVHLETQRARIDEVRDQLGLLLEHPLAPTPTPDLTGVEVPEAAPASAIEVPEPAPEAEAEFLPLEVAEVEVEVPDALAPEAVEEPGPSESVFGETPATDDVEDWSVTSEDAWADTPPPPPPPGVEVDESTWADTPPPPPPPPGLEVDESTWAEAPPPPPPPPPDFDTPGDAAATFGGLSGPAVPEQLPDLDEQAEEDNPWLAELADEEADAEDGRSRFGRRR